MATGMWEALQMPTAARIVLTANGHAEVACATSDIGTGTYTIMAQVAADMLGLPIENISVKLGDSTLPHVAGRGRIVDRGLGVATRSRATADEVRKELLRLAKSDAEFAARGARRSMTSSLSDGKIVSRQGESRAVSIADAMRRGRRRSHRTGEGKQLRGGWQQYARNTHSAIFAEVKVDEQLGVIRVTRVVNAVAAGRILNAKTARSQIMGGVVWGIGMALHEETLVDHHFGRIMNANIAEYHVPVNADVARHRGDFRRRAGRRSSIRSASRAWARSASSALRRRSPTRSITRPARACAICRSRSTSCCGE